MYEECSDGNENVGLGDRGCWDCVSWLRTTGLRMQASQSVGPREDFQSQPTKGDFRLIGNMRTSAARPREGCV